MNITQNANSENMQPTPTIDHKDSKILRCCDDATDLENNDMGSETPFPIIEASLRLASC